MDEKEIQSRADALVNAMLAKGMREPEATAMIKSQGQPSIHLQWKSRQEAKYGGDHAFEVLRADTLPEAVSKAEAWLADRPSPEQAKLNEFMAAVGAAADLGRELGIDAEFVNPLLVTMKSLSENALTYRGSAS